MFESSPECLMPVWDMAEVAFDPVSLGWDVEGEGLGAVVDDL